MAAEVSFESLNVIRESPRFSELYTSVGFRKNVDVNSIFDRCPRNDAFEI